MTVEIFVAPGGDDAGAGTATAPFATLARAQMAARAGRAAGPVTVTLRGGDYEMRAGLALTSADSGTLDAPVVYRAYPGEQARLVGGRRLPLDRARGANGWVPVQGPARERLEPAAREHVLQFDLRAAGITSFPGMQSRGFGRSTATAHLELFWNGLPLTVARWPNLGEFATIAGFPGTGTDDGLGTPLGRLEDGFFYKGDRPLRWAASDDIWVHGYWAYDWANSYERVARLDTAARHIVTAPPYGLYGFRQGNRFYFLNILEELDAPGEFFLDRERGLLYCWPPQPPRHDDEVLLSMLAEPLVTLRDASHITLRGLTFVCTRGHAVSIEGGAQCLIENCTISNTGNSGVVVGGGVDHGVHSCHIFNNGDSGVDLTGGDRKTLSPGRHFVQNCHFHHQARWSRCYQPAVHLHGVGLRVARNLIHDHPHCPLMFWGNDHTIELNEIHHVCYETGDVGAIYTGRDWTFQGNVVRHNYLHHIHGPGQYGSIAVYLDDCVSGITVYGNILAHTQLGLLLGGGRDCVIENNIFLDTHPAVQIDGRGVSQAPVWADMVNITLKQRLLEMHHHELPYATRFPQLQKIDAYLAAGKGVPPEDNVLARNLFAGGEWLTIHWGATPAAVRQQDNWTAGDPGWANPADPAAAGFALRPDAPVRKLGFAPIPFEQIGPVPQPLGHV
jgi:hypothetical protein